jgi:prevent-host-death family protein
MYKSYNHGFCAALNIVSMNRLQLVMMTHLGAMAMKKTVSVAQAKAQLSALMAEVADGGQHILIERRGKPIAALISVQDLNRLESEGPTSDNPLGGLGLAGAWDMVGDDVIDAMVDAIYKARDENTGRDVEFGL